MVRHLGAQYEAEREDHSCVWSESWYLVTHTAHVISILRLTKPSAGICGIVRTIALDGLNASEYICKTSQLHLYSNLLTITDDIVDMLIWSATESTATIMCSSIPVLRPLYGRFRYGSKGSDSGGSSGYKLPIYGNHSAKKHNTGTDTGDNSGPSRQTVIAYNANASDESILRDTEKQNENDRGGIRRTDEIFISYGEI